MSEAVVPSLEKEDSDATPTNEAPPISKEAPPTSKEAPPTLNEATPIKDSRTSQSTVNSKPSSSQEVPSVPTSLPSHNQAPPTSHSQATPTSHNQATPTLSVATGSPSLARGDRPKSINTSLSPTPVPPARTKKRKVCELRCCETRWFYKKTGDEKWTPFIGRDSMMLEMKFRLQNNIPLDDSAQEFADQLDLSQREMVVVLDGLFRLTEDQSKIEAIYWKDDSCSVRRGTWFTSDWQPLDSAIADAIDKHHLQYFRGQVVPEGTTVFSSKEASNKPQLTELHLDNMEVRWSSVIDIHFSVKRGAILRYIGWSKSQSLRRGFEKDCEWDDAAAEISHLILVVHGIGQKGYENLIAQNAQQVRDGVVTALEKGYSDEKTRPMFLPVEWRAALVLDNGVTDDLTLPKMSSMRTALNSTAMDIMYYQSPLYRKEIVAGVTRQLNRVYSLFKENNPSFDGPVSIFAHSLGSVIAYDILIHWSPLLLYDQYVTEAIDDHMAKCENTESASTMKAFKDARNALHENLDGGMKEVLLTHEERLKFKVKYLFAVGSPLGVFLVMRGATSADLQPAKMNVERIFNIFHPYDPVAYRLEPLFASEWKNIRPHKLFTFNDLRGRNSYDDLPLDVYKSYMKKLKKSKKNGKSVDARSGCDDEILDEEDECDSDDMDARSGCSSPRSLTPPPGEKVEKPAKKGWWFSSSSSSAPKKTTTTQSTDAPVEVAKEAESELPLAERILGAADRPPHRMDFQLQPAITDKSYWSVLKSHFAYWTNNDLALFIANVLYTKPSSTQQES